MLTDSHGRAITYLRISVTDRCNYRCTYCMPAEGVALKQHSEMLRYEDIIRIAKCAAEMGINKLRLTGGEPLIRRDIEFLVSGLAALPGVSDLCMTTNGSLLTREKAHALKLAGLHRVNVSLDTLDPARFAAITRGGDVRDAVGGVEAAVAAGLLPVKVNMVIGPDTTVAEREAIQSFCARTGARLQTISRFTLACRVHGMDHGADRPTPCEECNRLRLTADGHLKPCLFSDLEVKVNMEDIRGSILNAVARKPSAGTACTTRVMSEIGG